jgi:hypothetical protein
MTQQTAVEYLEESYNMADGYERHLTPSCFEKAKQMEKQQIVDALEIYKKEHLGTNSIRINGNAAELPTTTGNFIVKDKINLK